MTWHWWTVWLVRESSARGWYWQLKFGPVTYTRFDLDGNAGHGIALFGRWPSDCAVEA